MENNTGLSIIASVLQLAKEKNASDVHLVAGTRPMFRVDGELLPASEESVEPQEVESLLGVLLNDKHKEELQRAGQLEMARTVGELCRIRVNIFRQRGTYAMTMHLLPIEIPSVEELGLPDIMLTLAGKKSGLLLAAGTSGSGKTTTVASLVSAVTRSASRSVVTIERPIEYLYPPGQSIVCQREAGVDSLSYASALSSAMRQDTDIIVLGELKEPETISLAVTAAKTGHLVIAALHTDSAAEAVERLVDFYPTAQQDQMRTRLSDVLLAVTAQQLLPKREGEGRIAAFEALNVTPMVENLLREGKANQILAVMRTGQEEGMQTMDDAIYELYMKSRISAETAVRFAKDMETMRRKL